MRGRGSRVRRRVTHDEDRRRDIVFGQGELRSHGGGIEVHDPRRADPERIRHEHHVRGDDADVHLAAGALS